MLNFGQDTLELETKPSIRKAIRTDILVPDEEAVGTSHEVIEQRSRELANQLLALVLVSFSVLLTVFFLPSLQVLRIPVTYLLLTAEVYALYIAVRLYQAGTGPLPAAPFAAGCLFIVGGAALDIFATIARTPTLTQEANYVARALLDTGHSLTSVYILAFLGQILFLLFACVLWAAFLRHSKTVVALAFQARPRTYWEFMKAAAGGAQLTWRQFLFPWKLSELPRAYFMVWMIPLLLLVTALDRWYWGLNWFGILPYFSDTVRILTLCLLWAVVYLGWLWYCYRHLAPQRQ